MSYRKESYGLWLGRWMQTTRIDASACGSCTTKTSANAIYHCVGTNSGIFRGSLKAIYIPAVGPISWRFDWRRTEVLPPDYQEVPLLVRWNFSPSPSINDRRNLLPIIGTTFMVRTSSDLVRVSQPGSLSLLSRQRQHTLIKTFPSTISWLTSTQSVKLCMWKCKMYSWLKCEMCSTAKKENDKKPPRPQNNFSTCEFYRRVKNA